MATSPYSQRLAQPYFWNNMMDVQWRRLDWNSSLMQLQTHTCLLYITYVRISCCLSSWGQLNQDVKQMGSCVAHVGFCSMWERLLVLFQKSATCSNASSPVSHSNLILKELLTQGSFLHPKAQLGCQEENAGILVWDLSASTSVPFRGSLQPSVVGTSLSWWRERHCCGTIPAMKPSVFLTGIVFHLLKHSGSSSFGNLWSTKVKLARTPGFYPNCALLLS